MQTFREVHPKPRHLRDNQTMVVDNEGNYFIVSENTPIHQRQAGYKEVLVFPCDAMGEVDAWLEVGGRRYVGLSEFLADLLEGRETLDEALIEMVASASRRDAQEAFLAMAERHAKRRRGGLTRADRHATKVRAASRGDLSDSEVKRFVREHLLPGEVRAASRGDLSHSDVKRFVREHLLPGEVRAASRGDLSDSEVKRFVREHLLPGEVRAASRGDLSRSDVKRFVREHLLPGVHNPDELSFEAKHQRAVAMAYPFQLRSESGVNESFQSHAEALKWAESNLKKGEFFTISKDSDHFHEHYVKE